MSNVSNVFQQLLEILDEAGVTPDRVGQIETETGCLYKNDADLTFVDKDGEQVVIRIDGSIWSNNKQVALMEIREDAWYQAQEMIYLATQRAQYEV